MPYEHLMLGTHEQQTRYGSAPPPAEPDRNPIQSVKEEVCAGVIETGTETVTGTGTEQVTGTKHRTKTETEALPGTETGTGTGTGTETETATAPDPELSHHHQHPPLVTHTGKPHLPSLETS